MWRKKKVVIPGAAVLLLLVAGGAWMSLGRGQAGSSTTQPTTATVTRGRAFGGPLHGAHRR